MGDHTESLEILHIGKIQYDERKCGEVQLVMEGLLTETQKGMT